MDSIVKKLSEIETSAVAIVEHAKSEKDVLKEEMLKKQKEFDDSLEQDTQKKLNDIRTKLEHKMEDELKKQQQMSERSIHMYQSEYNTQHEIYAHNILSHITEV